MDLNMSLYNTKELKENKPARETKKETMYDC